MPQLHCPLLGHHTMRANAAKTRLDSFVHVAPGEFEYGGFSTKRFPSILRQRKLKTQQSWVIVDLCLLLLNQGEITSSSLVHRFLEKLRFKMLSFTLKRKAGVFSFSSLKSVFGSSVVVTDECER